MTTTIDGTLGVTAPALNITGTSSLTTVFVSATLTAPTVVLTDSSTNVATTSFVKGQNYLTSNQSITITGDVSGTGNSAITLTLASTGVTAGTYNTVVVNGKGLVTSASNVAYGTGGTGSVVITATGAATGATTGSNGTYSLPLTLATSGITAGTYNNVVFNTYGIATSGTLLSYLTTNQSITVSGDASGTGTTAITLTLATVNATPGTYTAFVVNSKGLITSVINQTFTGDVSGTGSASVTSLTLATVNSTPGTFNTVVVNAKGLVTSASNATYGVTPVTTVGSATASQALVFATSGNNCYDITLTQNCTITLTGGTTGQYQQCVLIIRQNSTAGWTPTLPSGVKWSGGVAPTPNTTAGKIDLFTFSTSDGGVTLFGSY
jgi:hypothetical protein